VYVFPPKILKKKDFQAFRALDAKFAERLFGYCRGMIPVRMRGRSAEVLVSSFMRLAWGFILCGAPEDSAAVNAEIRAGVKLLLNGFASMA
jgi:hypothetical protein